MSPVGGYVLFHLCQLTSRLVNSYRKFVGEYDEVICDEVGDAKEHFHGLFVQPGLEESEIYCRRRENFSEYGRYEQRGDFVALILRT